MPNMMESAKPAPVEKPIKAEDADIINYQQSDPYDAKLDFEMNHKENRTVPHYSEKSSSEWSRTNLTAAERTFVHDYVELVYKRDRAGWIREFDEKVNNQKEVLKKYGQKREVPKTLKKPRKSVDTKLTVHVIPHTHDDVGWLKTVDQYFSGAFVRRQHANVNMILSTVVRELQKDPKRLFTYVEMKFFTMWYKIQDEKTKAAVKKLIQSGQLEITQGGWVATDEACPNYEDMILNMHIGHEFLFKEFGVRPKIGWMLDAFGHSDGNAALYHDFGFEGLLFTRMADLPHRNDWKDKKKQTFVWETNANNFGGEKQLLTHVTLQDYDPPEQLRYDESKADKPIVIADKENPDFNVDIACHALLNYTQEQTDLQVNKENVPVLYGSDFFFQNAYLNFMQIEPVMDFCNENFGKSYNIEFKYSTPSRFFSALRKEKVEWPAYRGDFFPYDWTAYPSTRPNFKIQVKHASQLYHAQARAFARRMLMAGTTEAEAKAVVQTLRAAEDQLSILQHHDAITGTHAAAVGIDYLYNLNKALKPARNAYSEQMYKRLQQRTGLVLENTSLNIKMCGPKQANDTSRDCMPISMDLSKNGSFHVAVHNPSSATFEDLVRVQVENPNFQAQVFDDQQGAFVDVASEVFEQEHFAKDGKKAPSTYLSFIQVTIAPDAVALIKLVSTNHANLAQEASELVQLGENEMQAQKSSLQIKGFTEDSYVVFQYSNVEQGVSENFGVNLKKYLAHQQRKHMAIKEDPSLKENHEQHFDGWTAEGAYSFQPEWRDPMPSVYGKLDENVSHQKGKLVEQWTIRFDKPSVVGGAEQGIIRVRFNPRKPDLIEFHVELNQINVGDYQGKDVMVNWKMLDDFKAYGKFYTDANGLQMIERKKKYYEIDVPGANADQDNKPNFRTIMLNFYPVTSAIAMKDEKRRIQVTVMNDRSQAGAADLTDRGTIELMQHRRTVHDDNAGLIEAINDLELDNQGQVVNATYHLQIHNLDKGSSLQRSHQVKMQQPLQFFYLTDKNVKFDAAVKGAKKAVSKPFDFGSEKVNMRLFPVAKNQIIVRFDNLADAFDKDSEDVDIDVQKFARHLYTDVNGAQKSTSVVIKVEELDTQMVHAAQTSELPKLKIKSEEQKKDAPKSFNQLSKGLRAMQIRSFRITYELSSKKEEKVSEFVEQASAVFEI